MDMVPRWCCIPAILTCQLSILIIATLRQGQSGFLGADLTPHYPFAEDAAQFHSSLKQATLTIQSITQCLSAGAMNIYKASPENRGVGVSFLTTKMVRGSCIEDRSQIMQLLSIIKWSPSTAQLGRNVCVCKQLWEAFLPTCLLWSGGDR